MNDLEEKRQMVQKLGDLQEVAAEVREEVNKELEYDPDAWWEKQTKLLNDAILESARRGNAQSQKLASQLSGLLVEKTEQKVNIELTADEIAKQHIENRKWLREHGYLEETRVGQVQSKQPLLPEDIRKD